MLSGKAFMMSHPRRKEQDFVSCSAQYIAKELSSCIQIGWAFRLTFIRYCGDEALPINTRLTEVWELLSERDKVRVTLNYDEMTYKV